MPYSAEQMFDLVADVARYPEFLPWIVATRVRSNTETVMVADMVVGFKAINERFTSRVEKKRPDLIQVRYVDGPLRNLDNQWRFRAVDERSCEIEFSVEFTFKSRMFEALAGQYFDRAFGKMVAAFQSRAEQLYGTQVAAQFERGAVS